MRAQEKTSRILVVLRRTAYIHEINLDSNFAPLFSGFFALRNSNNISRLYKMIIIVDTYYLFHREPRGRQVNR